MMFWLIETYLYRMRTSHIHVLCVFKVPVGLNFPSVSQTPVTLFSFSIWCKTQRDTFSFVAVCLMAFVFKRRPGNDFAISSPPPLILTSLTTAVFSCKHQQSGLNWSRTQVFFSFLLNLFLYFWCFCLISSFCPLSHQILGDGFLLLLCFSNFVKEKKIKKKCEGNDIRRIGNKWQWEVRNVGRFVSSPL